MADTQTDHVHFKGQLPNTQAPLSATQGLGPHHAPKTFTAPPANGPSPNEPPVPPLQKHGFNGGIGTFNQRVQNVVDSYTKAYGMKPPPGLVFDLAKSPIHDSDFQHMFTVPQSLLAAKNRGIAVEHGYDPNAPIITSAKQLANGILNSAQNGNYHQYISQHLDLIHQFTQGDSAAAAQIAGAVFKARRIEAFSSTGPGLSKKTLQQAGLAPTDAQVSHWATDATNFFGRAVSQVSESLVHSPAGIYDLAKAAGLDMQAGVEHPASHHQLSHLTPIAKGMVKQTAQDVEHPGRNPGYLFLDILGIASPVASGAARVGEAGSALRAGEGAGAAARALATKPLRRATVRYGGYSEEMPLSQNPIVSAFQQYVIDKRVAHADSKLATPQAGTGFLADNVARRFFDNQLSLPKKVSRLAEQRQRLDYTSAMHIKNELDAAAGHAYAEARKRGKIGARFKGLSRGEQKAIQVMSWDASDPLAAERSFHETMVATGFNEKFHRQQLADLELAKKVLDNPSERFKKALALTKQVVAEMQMMKIQDLGLLPETAEGRIAKAGQALRGEELTGGQRVSEESFYLPTKMRGKGNPKVPERPVAIKAGQYGVPLPRSLPELNKEFGAKVIYDGNMRVDATHLASEAYARTVRAVSIRSEHQKLWDAALDTPDSIPEQFRMPIRDAQVIKNELRDAVSQLDEGWIDPKVAASLPEDSKAILDELYPSMRHIDQIEGVKWFDSRLLTEGSKVPHIPGTAADVAQALNSPFRFTALFLRPAYILNKFGNAAMLVFDQGIHTVPNYIRALDGKNLYGAENMREIYDHVGAGKSRSYVASSSGRFSHAVADFWNRVADRDERAAAFIHYMRLKGYKTQEDVSRLLHDKEARADLNEVRDRANKSLVQFDNLLPIEKNFLRHLIFVYPWVSRSAVWSIRAVFEHPTKTAILSQLGREDLENDPIWKHASAWFKRIGYVPLGWNADGTPRVVNPTSVNTFSTLGDFVAFAKSQTVGDKYASAEDFLGPAAKFAIHVATGRDEFGNQYPGSQWWGAAKEVLAGLPQVSAYEKAGKTKKGEAKQFNLASRKSLETAINANLKKTVMSPGWLNGYGTLLVGGFSPKSVNLPALEARYWSDQNPDVRHQHELDLLNRALKIQADALGRPVSPEVKDAIRVQSNLNYQYKLHLKETGRPANDKERAMFTLAYLKKDGRVPAALATKLSKQLATEGDPREINRITNSLLSKYGNGEAMHQWDSDVRSLASFTPQIFNEKVGSLFSQGLADQRKYNVSQEKLYDYGRKYIAYKHEAKKLQNSGASSLELKAFEDAHDTPVDGLPSFPRIAWSEQTPANQKAHIASIVTQSWGSLSGFDKTILGRPTDPKITQGWVTLNKIIDDQRKALAREGRTFPSGYDRTLAKYVEKYYDAPGLVKDFDFSKQPEYQRLKYLKPIQDSPNKNLWSQLFSVAAGYSKYLHATDGTGQKAYSATQVRQMWKDYLGSKGFQSWLAEHPDFRSEIASYGKGTISGLIG